MLLCLEWSRSNAHRSTVISLKERPVASLPRPIGEGGRVCITSPFDVQLRLFPQWSYRRTALQSLLRPFACTALSEAELDVGEDIAPLCSDKALTPLIAY